jgi:hypothetical protein
MSPAIRAALALFLLVLVAATGAGVWQELRYLRARRELVQDRQPLFHSAEVFHVVTFLELAPGADLFDAVRRLRTAVESGGSARMVYAGKVALEAIASAQPRRWSRTPDSRASPPSASSGATRPSS